MKPREIILDQIGHRETSPVPFTLGFEGDVAERLDEHYGNPKWRQQLTPYMTSVSAVETLAREIIDDTRVRDLYGAVWRLDRRPWHLE
ncbi:MAG: hypothetical protein HOC74_26340, partial [Gemmatimonadetes bacterium]|nr:hypothetical protein [Gemmatimonadota bacterium]